jgi:hypothetical protein
MFWLTTPPATNHCLPQVFNRFTRDVALIITLPVKAFFRRVLSNQRVRFSLYFLPESKAHKIWYPVNSVKRGRCHWHRFSVVSPPSHTGFQCCTLVVLLTSSSGPRSSGFMRFLVAMQRWCGRINLLTFKVHSRANYCFFQWSCRREEKFVSKNTKSWNPESFKCHFAPLGQWKVYSLGYRVSFGATSMEFQSFIEEIWPKQCRVETCFWLQIFPHMTTSLKRTISKV